VKLIICMVNDKDVPALLAHLIKKSYRATKLSSTGGFLKEGNTTLLIGVEEEKLEDVIAVIKEVCHARRQMAPPLPPLAGLTESYVTFPIEVTVGGATIFVINVEQSMRV
jgi:uncharacterized protein YaaQ